MPVISPLKASSQKAVYSIITSLATVHDEFLTKCWKVLESIVDRGLVKAIGVSNFSITKIERLLQTADIVPAVNQVECHPYFQQPKLVRYCNSKGIVVEAYASLGRPSHPDKSMPVVLEDPVIAKIAAKHSATASQV